MTTSASVVAFHQDVTPEVVVADAKVDTMALTALLTATISLDKETKSYVSYCPTLNLCSQGDTLEEAKENIVEATELFIETCFECGDLIEVLKDCGFYLADDEPQSPPKRELTTDIAEIDVFQFSANIPIKAQIPDVEYL